jgi:hypothetical protein
MPFIERIEVKDKGGAFLYWSQKQSGPDPDLTGNLKIQTIMKYV